ncbi:hypothetical protein ABK040_001885 [Willaertia magna]
MPPATEENKILDERQSWIERCVRNALRIAERDSKKLIETDDFRKLSASFFESQDCKQLFVYYNTSNTLSVSVSPPSSYMKKVIYFIKQGKATVTPENISTQVLFGEISNVALESLSLLSKEIFLPVLQEKPESNENQEDESINTDVVSYFHKFMATIYVTLGQLEGRTLLPLPPEDIMGKEQSDKDVVHALETAVVNWSNQIKEVLKKDPESLFTPTVHPGPLDEIQFWEEKHSDLVSIIQQLNSEKVQKVIDILKNSQSSYIPSFLKMVEEVEEKKNEALENHRFLKPLRRFFESVNIRNDNHAEFMELQSVIKVIFHLIYLTWKNSTTYNKSERLIVLIREICNDLIEHAKEYIGGKEIFNMEFADAVEKMENTLSICALFKRFYFAYKAKVEQECPENQWKIQPVALFHRLDMFLERCRDILNIFNQVKVFNKAATVQIGGTKGDALTKEVKDIFTCFSEDFAKFKEITYDALSVEEQKFEEDFYFFRNQIKEYEKKIGSIISKSFEESNTIHAGVKVIESFDFLLDRETIQQEIMKKQSDLVKMYRRELKRVQATFTERKSDPPISHNAPPISGSLFWSESLLERINGPMNSLLSINKNIFDGAEGKDTYKLYTNIVKNIKKYQQEKYDEWSTSVAEISESKLQEKLLKSTDQNLVQVNFDAALVRLLREVNYLEKLNSFRKEDEKLQIPTEALDLFSKNEKYRTQTGSLEYVVNMYNNIQVSLLEVERPLFQKQLEKIDSILKRATNELSWKSESEIDEFLVSAMNAVKLANNTLGMLKKNVSEIEKVLSKWERNPMFQRKETRTLNMKEFDGRHKEMRSIFEKMVRKGAEVIQQKVKDSLEVLKGKKTEEAQQPTEDLGSIGVDENSSEWKNYVQYIINIIIDGICKSVLASLKGIQDQMNAEFLQKTEQSPLIEISLILIHKKHSSTFESTFSPCLSEKEEGSLKQIVDSWINDFCSIYSLIPKLDSSDEDYKQHIQNHVDIKATIASIYKNLKGITQECIKFSELFKSFSYIYEKDQEEVFNDFLAENDTKTKDADLSKFNEQIKRFRGVYDQLKDLPNCDNVGWLRVDAKPIKQDLLRLCSSWEKLFSNYLANNVHDRLEQIYKFMSTVEGGIDKEVTEGDVAALREVIRYIRDIKIATESEHGIFKPLQDIAEVLSSHGVELSSSLISNLEHAPSKWDALYKRSLMRRNDLSDLQDKESHKVKEQGAIFGRRVLQFQDEFRQMAAFLWKSGPSDAYKSIDKWQISLISMEKEASTLKDLQDLFELTVSEYNALSTCREETLLLKTLWDISAHILSMFKDWMKTSFKKVDVDLLVDETKKLKRVVQNFNVKARIWDCYNGLSNTVNNMLTSLPLVQDLRSPAMRKRHWDELLNETNTVGAIDPEDDSFSLEQLLDLGLHSYVETVQTIVDKASKELIIEKNLTRIQNTWEQLKFTFNYDDELKCVLLGAVEEIVEVLEDNQVQLQNMSTMRYVEFFIEELTKWQTTLATVDSVINEWVTVQKKWQNLYPIFVLSKDIIEQLPDDAIRFISVDKSWRALMEVAKTVTKITEACTESTIRVKLNSSKDLLELLISMEEDLEKCQKSLADYLETKCRAFPRFYFIKDQDVIDILSKGSFPRLVMKHMSKIVEAVATLTFDDNTDMANGLISKEGEVIAFGNKYECKGPVEQWLNGVLETIQHSLHIILGDSHAAYVEQQRDQWVFAFPAQIIIVASRIWFTAEVNSAFERQEEGNKNALKDYYNQLKDQLAKLTGLVQTDLKSGDRKKIITLITVDVHNRDIVLKLIEEKAENAQVFTWQSQLRYIWDDAKGCIINIADAEFKYGYEYIGNSGCLVITPLTDRCYITLTQSLRLVMGGAPAGPAGTGKTETTKDLGRALGMQVYVFNCTEQMTPASLGNIFKGLAMTGTWGCFDEFNRVRVGVLSVVATQFKSILDAIRAQKKIFDFEQQSISLIPTCGVFITMNPGYKGRTELPENLKALFRPCAMVVPDFLNICEIMLASEGFISAKELAKKFVTLYKLNKELLSKQDHYDWGLRAIKSVLVIAGGLKRAEPTISEEKILMRALRDTNLAKLSRDDVEIFRGLIRDLFPRIEIEPKSDPELVSAIKKATNELNLQTGENDIFISKVVQFKELLDVRHSVFVLGPAGSAKSCVWKTLSKAFEIQDKKTWYHVLNPKSVTSNELYGYTHPVSGDWKDGLLSFVMREMSETHSDTPKWIVLDGDIDAEWIESMNTVMDDNKVLTLANNERIPLTPSMRMLFEIDHLRNATPATVSRAGILFLNETDVGWQPFKESWIETRNIEKEKQTLDRLFFTYAPHILTWLKKHAHIIPRNDINMIQTLCYLLEGLITPETCPSGTSNETYEHYFAFACIWAFGGALEEEERVLFNGMFKKDFPQIKFPENSSIFDFYVVSDEEGVARLEPWSTRVTEYIHDPEKPFGEIVVTTSDTARLSYLMDLLANKRKPVLLVGTAGTGKTTIVKGKLRNLDEDTLYSVINFNSNTDAESFQNILEQSITKKAGKLYGPPGRKKLIYFIDDLNMPNPDKYGTQSAVEFLRQHMDYGFWYDRAKMSVKEVSNVQYIAAMNPKAGSFTVTNRLQRHFGIFACTFPAPSDLKTIYQQIISSHLETFDKRIYAMSDKLVDGSIKLHKEVSKQFLPTALKFHYQFNLREISNIFQGLCRSTKQYYTDPVQIVRLWAHESFRVFSDRMIEQEDVKLFDTIISKVAKDVFDVEISDGQNIVFTSFIRGNDSGQSIYCEEQDYAILKQTLEKKLEEYNQNRSVMNLELFRQAIWHVCRISRILNNPRGNALLVGVGGSGKQSLARLASFINSYDIFQITVTTNYNVESFKKDLLDLYKKAGEKDVKLSFILTDSQIVNEKQLVYVNDFLSSGYIPELFNQDEQEKTISAVQAAVKYAGKDHNDKKVCWDFFLDKVKNNLHMILCFSPVGDQLRVWCRKFPAIMNCTVIDWFHEWPADALISVASRFLMADQELALEEEMVNNIANHMAFVHQTVGEASVEYRLIDRRYNYTTPKSFLELIELYKSLLKSKRRDLVGSIDRLIKGLRKIDESEEKIKELGKTLASDAVVVEEKKRATEELLAKVTKENTVLATQQKVVEEEESKQSKVVEAVNQLAEECNSELAAAQPLIEKAKAALAVLNVKDIQELKSFTNPPNFVDVITAAVMILKSARGVPRNVQWAESKKMMNNPSQFIAELLTFNEETIPKIPEENIKALQNDKYLNNTEFDTNKTAGKSKAAAGLCEWCQAVAAFYDLDRNKIDPLRTKLNQALEEKEKNEGHLKKISEKLNALRKAKEQAELEHNNAQTELTELEIQQKKTEDKLDLAQRLVNGLKDEKIRWDESIGQLKEKEKTVIGDVLLASAFLSYVGPFTKKYRQNLVEEKWLADLRERKIPTSEGVDALNVLTEEAQIAQWNNEGLPSDRVSIENGAIVTNCKRWPLLIDPQLQGVKWIKNMESKRNLQVIQISKKGYLENLSHAIINGYPVLIEGIGESIDPILEPLLSQSYTVRGKTKYIKLGDREVQFDEKFRLYLQTKLPNPHYRPEIVAQTTLLNFMVTEQGLDDQLLGTVVNKERPDLEEQRISYLRQLRQFKIELKECEESLKDELNKAKDLLESKSLVEKLEEIKQKSKQIKTSFKEIEENNKLIDESRSVYRTVSIRGSMLYFLIDQLSFIDHMYQYSLEAFMVVFNKALDKAEPGENVTIRVDNIVDSITETLFSYVSRGLFERHKLIFSTMLCIEILKKKGEIEQAQIEFLLRGPKVFGVERKENVIGWCSETSWAAVQALTHIEGTQPAFSTLPDDMAGSWRKWKEWTEFEKPEEKPLPLEWKNLTPFQKLLIIRCLRPDRLTMAVTAFVSDKIGEKYVKDIPVDLEVSYGDAGPTTPLFFILSPGVDPLKAVEKLGEKLGFSGTNHKFKNVSLGEGQTLVAEYALENAFSNGGWVMLNNLHLTPEWLPALEKKLDHYAEIFSRQEMKEKKKREKEATKRKVKKNKTESEETEEHSEELEKKEHNHEEEEHGNDSDDEEIKGHKDFRVFLSAEPSNKIPIGILQRSIKLTNEPPSGIRANLFRALMQFDDNIWEGSSKQTEFKGILFSLCFFHAVIVERKKFGPQGWNRNYPFNLGDLTTCIAVLNNYLEDRPKVPWEDLRYVFGEIMYGGHITDDLDRRLCRTYLEKYIRPEIVDQIELSPAFLSPPTNLSYKGYLEYTENNLPPESPIAFGLHPNAEIGFRTAQGENLFTMISEMQPRSAVSGDGLSYQEKVRNELRRILDALPEPFNLEEIADRLDEERTPYQNSFYQECEYMNRLLAELDRSLKELQSGLDGLLTISDKMQELSNALYNNKVPETWSQLAYPSLRKLDIWFDDLLQRNSQLQNWAGDLQTPKVVWISGFFNPQSFLTAIMQTTARQKTWALDEMTLIADVTKKYSIEEIEQSAREGAYITGLCLEGAGWDSKKGSLVDSKLKDLHPKMPIMHIKAVQNEKSDPNSFYDCPVYKTQERGPDFVFSCKLKTIDPPSKWVLAGVALLLDVVDSQ